MQRLAVGQKALGLKPLGLPDAPQGQHGFLLSCLPGLGEHRPGQHMPPGRQQQQLLQRRVGGGHRSSSWLRRPFFFRSEPSDPPGAASSPAIFFFSVLEKLIWDSVRLEMRLRLSLCR